MKRLQLGLTDAERREHDTRRRTRNRLLVLTTLVLLVGFLNT